MSRPKYCKWETSDMERAIGAIRRGDMGLNAAAKTYGVPKATLSRHEKKQNIYANEDVKFHGGVSCLGEDLEQELIDQCLALEERFFGLTMNELRELAYQLAESNGIAHNFSKDAEMAGKKWYYGFMRRHPKLSLREPESTSLARAQGFNKPRVEAFFKLLSEIYDKHKLTPHRLYNMDETSLSTVQDGQRKIVGRRGKRQIGALTSQERGESSTCVVCCNAAGNYVPPMVIYKRKRMKPELTNGGPPGAVYSCQENGWMSNEGFLTWLKHFIEFAKPTKGSTVVLVLDGHVTHTKNLAAITMARDVGVVMVSVPPHCTHRLQPLDVAFFGPFGKYYDDALRVWMRQHVGRPVTTWQVAEILNVAYGKAASVQNAVSGFRKSGLWALTMDIFQDSDFSPATLTDVSGKVREDAPTSPNSGSSNTQGDSTDTGPNVLQINTTSEDVPKSPHVSSPDTDPVPSVLQINTIPEDLRKSPNNPADPTPHAEQLSNVTTGISTKKTIMKHVCEVSPFPKADASVKKRKAGRPTSQACELTGSPYKQTLEETLANRPAAKKRKAQLKKPTTIKLPKSKAKNNESHRQVVTRPSPHEDSASSDEANVESVTNLKSLLNIADCDIGQWCALLYEGKIYPGKIVRKTESINPTVQVQAMTIAGVNKFKWPTKKDIDEYELQEIISIIPEPKAVTSRNMQIDPLLWQELKDFESR
ncbi:Uncharacterised protein r2_g2668 [Pycnogonum litorale]